MIRLLDQNDADSIKPLFYLKNYMGVDPKEKDFYTADEYAEFYHESFVQSYLTGLNSYKAFGKFDDGVCQGLISFYISPEDPCWYGTQIRSLGDRQVVRDLLDTAIEYNEKSGRLKFYTLWSKDHVKFLRRFAFNSTAAERYDYIDEYEVPAKTKCVYNAHWQILFNRVMIPIDTVVRCTYLKSQYRDVLPKGGNL